MTSHSSQCRSARVAALVHYKCHVISLWDLTSLIHVLLYESVLLNMIFMASICNLVCPKTSLIIDGQKL